MKLQTVGLLSALVLLPCVAANGNACAFQQVYTGSFSRTGTATATGTRRLDTGFSLRSSLMEDATDTETARTPTPTLSELPPILQDIVDERNEFRLNLGRAMDVLKQDYPEILRKTPDFSIYHDEITLVDSSGTQLTGLKNYKTAFSFLQTMINFLYSQEKSSIQMRMVYDFVRSSIRISWNVILYPKGPFGKPLYVDGVSLYHLDASSGKITEHKIDNLLINQTPVQPPYGIFSTLLQESLVPQQGGPRGVLCSAMDDNGAFFA